MYPERTFLVDNELDVRLRCVRLNETDSAIGCSREESLSEDPRDEEDVMSAHTFENLQTICLDCNVNSFRIREGLYLGEEHSGAIERRLIQ